MTETKTLAFYCHKNKTFLKTHKKHVVNISSPTDFQQHHIPCPNRTHVFGSNTKSTPINRHFLHVFSLILIPNDCCKSATTSEITISDGKEKQLLHIVEANKLVGI